MGDDVDFSELMSGEGVKPLAQRQDKVALKTPDDRTNREARREAAEHGQRKDRNFLSLNEVPAVSPYDIVEFKRDGIQHGVFKKLKQGRYLTDTKLDLHRHTAEQARQMLYQFVLDCVEHDIRCALILHGKGMHTPDDDGSGRRERKPQARIKSCVVHWLKQLEQVQAFSSAQPKDGGAGAVYVLFRKSERQKDKNRQRFINSRQSAD